MSNFQRESEAATERAAADKSPWEGGDGNAKKGAEKPKIKVPVA